MTGLSTLELEALEVVSPQIIAPEATAPETIDNVLVVKVGTSSLVAEGPDGKEYLDSESFDRIGEELVSLQDEGQNVVVVTSASITAGMIETGTRLRPDPIEQKEESQMLSAIGNRNILNAWHQAARGQIIGNLLLTRQELKPESTERAKALTTVHSMLSRGYLPVVNENDAIADEEIMFGDNDVLSAILAARMAKERDSFKNVRLVILTDTNGVYKNPKYSSTLLDTIHDLSKFDLIAGPSGSKLGTGGMRSKYLAAKEAKPAGVDMWIANGRTKDVIRKALNLEAGTFIPGDK